MASVNLNQNIVSALCKYFPVDADTEKCLRDDVDSDLKSLCMKILKSTENGDAVRINDDEFTKWVAFAESLPKDSNSSFKVLSKLNDDLITKAVLLGSGFTPSAADIIVFASVHLLVVGLPNSNRVKLPHLMRWIDYIQNIVKFGDLFDFILVEKAAFDPPVVQNELGVEPRSTTKITVQEKKEATGAKAESIEVKTADKKVTTENQAVTDKKNLIEKETVGKDGVLPVSLLKIQIGVVRKASQHPSADSLLVEEIDIGEGKNRQVVSGLAKHISLEQLTNRLVVLITNVKPSKLRDIMSEGLVLCASNQDHSVVEPLIVPEGAKIGECVTFSGFEGKPEDVLNPKKKQLEKIAPHLLTDSSGIATYKGVPFMTCAGPCKSSIPNACIK